MWRIERHPHGERLLQGEEITYSDPMEIRTHEYVKRGWYGKLWLHTYYRDGSIQATCLE